MSERNKLTLSELSTLLEMYQSLTAIFTFFAGFVFVTIPLVVFSAEISSLYGRFVVYSLLACLLIFTLMIDLYHSAVFGVYQQTSPITFRIFRKHPEPRLAEQLFGIAIFLVSFSISFMLLLKGQEWIIEAIIWFIISTGRMIFGHLITHRFLKKAPKYNTEAAPKMLIVFEKRKETLHCLPLP